MEYIILNSFFNSKAADVVQLVALPVEIIGFTLALIEIYFTDLARQIESFLDDYEDFLWRNIKKLSIQNIKTTVLQVKEIIRANFGISKSERKFSWAAVLTLLAGISVMLAEVGLDLYIFKLPLLPSIAVIFVMILLLLHFVWVVVIMVTLILALVSLVMLVFFVPIVSSINFLNRLTKGRALGAIGLILAFCGLLGEIYQVVTMFSE